ncbi:MAG: L-rhamnose-proton symporter, partial [Phycisphaerales bacterium]|nr:L-rhamnose-proton symporter [Phycisphaerales bacterium]
KMFLSRALLCGWAARDKGCTITPEVLAREQWTAVLRALTSHAGPPWSHSDKAVHNPANPLQFPVRFNNQRDRPVSSGAKRPPPSELNLHIFSERQKWDLPAFDRAKDDWMTSNLLAGLVYHWIGGLAAASFYIPYKLIRRWAWETYWLVSGFFSWVIAPTLMALLLVPDLFNILRHAPGRSVALAFGWGMVWGVGGLTFGLTIRYLGIALGVAIALGLCTACGTLIPPLADGSFGQIVHRHSGQVILLGIGVCLAGIVVNGIAGVSKEKELSDADKQSGIAEFHFWKGLGVATCSGVMSAAFAYGLAAGKPVAEITRGFLRARGGSELWQNLPVLILVTAGGFVTNFVWCVYLNVKNRSGHQYLAFRVRDTAEIDTSLAVAQYDASETSAAATAAVQAERPAGENIPLLINYLFAAAGGIVWYLQFFFYSMGETRMGHDYAFSSWTLHMASIIIFGTLWGFVLQEWKGASARTQALVAIGMIALIGSTLIVGYGNFLKSSAAPAGVQESRVVVRLRGRANERRPAAADAEPDR